jgi:hypothetical protein
MTSANLRRPQQALGAQRPFSLLIDLLIVVALSCPF